MRSLLFFVGIPFALIFAGCSTSPERRLETVEVRIVSLKSSADGQAVIYRLLNPNTVSLPITKSSHVLSLGNTRIGRIDDRDAIGIPQLGVVEETLVVPAALGESVRTYLATHPGQIRVSLQSTLEITLYGDETMTMKTRGSGLVTP